MEDKEDVNEDKEKSIIEKEFNLIKDLPDYQRVPAENRFILIQQYKAFLKSERKLLGKKFRKTQALRSFCNTNNINPNTFYLHLKTHREGGIKALQTAYGKRKGRTQFDDIIPIIHNIFDSRKNYTSIFKELVNICDQQKIKAPSYDTFIRLLKINKQLIPVSENEALTSPIEQSRPKEIEKIPESRKYPLKVDFPDWIKIVDKKAFNIAIYKYCLVIPFLRSDLKLKGNKTPT